TRIRKPGCVPGWQPRASPCPVLQSRHRRATTCKQRSSNMKYPDYGKACQLWRSAAAEAWQGYVCHPFVEQLGQGTLPRAAFLHYLRQDYVCLIHFARAWSLAAAKAETLEEMQAASATVYTLLHSERALHMGICAAAGISREELEATPERRENQAYTRYVLEAGYS